MLVISELYMLTGGIFIVSTPGAGDAAIDLFVLSCGMQFPCRDAIIKCDVSIRSTFCTMTADIQ